MARRDERREESNGERLRCAACGESPIDVGTGGSGTCPNCRESYSVYIGEAFALVETDGWVVQVAVDERTGESADIARA